MPVEPVLDMVTNMDADIALATATEAFRSRLGTVTSSQLDSPSPCDGWTVSDLLAHVIGGNDMAIALVGGCTLDEARSSFSPASAFDDPLGACEISLDAQLSALGPGLDMTKTVHHPMGDMPAAQLMEFRIGDLLLHSWDLARAIGGDDRLPEDLVARVYGNLEPMEAVIASIGVFGSGPSGTLGADADVQTRLLDLTGRRPS
jgi:uncharacterized protein (TIGR03086 family)